MKEDKYEDGYWARLKDHPGIGYAAVFHIAAMLAGGMNESMTLGTGLIFGSCVGSIVWVPVLWTNRK
jgi:hypothetical protein